MAQKGRFKMSDDAAAQLESLVRSAVTACRAASAPTEDIIADIYAGRDWLSSVEGYVPEQGVPIKEWYGKVRDGKSWNPPQTMANLLQSRLRVVTAGLNPGVPVLHVKPEMLGAVKAADNQEQIFRILMRTSGMEDTMRDYSYSAMVAPYAGVRVWMEKQGPWYTRFGVERISCRDCGWEPFYRRFRYHKYQRAYEQLPREHQLNLLKALEIKEKDVQPWAMVDVMEVYHEGFRAGHVSLTKTAKCPKSTWLQLAGDGEGDSTPADKGTAAEVGIGQYVGTTLVERCPIVIASFLEPADNEDVPPSEVASWLPPLRNITNTLIQVNREVSTSNNIVLYDERIEEEHIDTARDAPSSARVFIPIATDEHGVAQKMRPMEKQNLIQELLLAHNLFMNMFNEVLGVTATNMGIAEQPRKSATEAGAIDRNSSLRNQDRLKIIAKVWEEVAFIFFANQRTVLGTKIEVMLSNSVALEMEVPSLAEAEVSFRVDPVELGHLSKQDEADQLLGWVTIFSNAFLQFQGSIPRIIRESLRRVAKLMGIENVDAYLEAPVIEKGPEDRYIQALETGEDITVLQDDDHVLFLSYYTAVLDRGMRSDNPLQVRVSALKDAIEEHQRFLDISQQGNNATAGPGNNPSIVPGFSPDGQQNAQIDAASGSLFPIDKQSII